MHEQSIIDSILERLSTTECDLKVISLIATKETLTKRIMDDINTGKRTMDMLERSIARIPLYQRLDSIKIQTDEKTILEITKEIIDL